MHIDQPIKRWIFYMLIFFFRDLYTQICCSKTVRNSERSAMPYLSRYASKNYWLNIWTNLNDKWIKIATVLIYSVSIFFSYKKKKEKEIFVVGYQHARAHWCMRVDSFHSKASWALACFCGLLYCVIDSISWNAMCKCLLHKSQI